MNRLLFEKRGDAVYLSHLDLMRVFQRAFKRAGILIWHSQGFSPRAYVSIALPLPVGMESRCEILDFEIEDGSGRAFRSFPRGSMPFCRQVSGYWRHTRARGKSRS